MGDRTKCYPEIYIARIGKNVLELPNNVGMISLKNYQIHCYVPYGIFCDGIIGSKTVMLCANAQ